MTRKIKIRTDKPFYVGGETVTGHVHVVTSDRLVCHGVKLKVKGEEKCEFQRWHVTYTTVEHPVQGLIQQAERQVRTEKGNRDFLDRKENFLHVGPLEAGEHNIPFQVHLPHNLPGSFHMKGSHDGLPWSAKVHYKVKAVVDIEGHDLKATQSLVIHEPTLQQAGPVEVKKDGAVVCCCCINRGTVHMKALFQTLQVFPGQRLNVSLEVKNESSMDITRCVLKLMRVIRVAAAGHSFTLVDVVGNATHFTGIHRMDSLKQDVFLDIHHGVQPATTLGHHVTCTFHVDVEADIPWAPDVEIHQKIDVLAPIPGEWGSDFHVKGAQPATYEAHAGEAVFVSASGGHH